MLQMPVVSACNLHLFLGELRGRLPPYRIHTLLGYVELFLRVKHGWLGCRRQIGHDEVAKQRDRDADDTIEDKKPLKKSA
jgi:hypothetical protein